MATTSKVVDVIELHGGDVKALRAAKGLNQAAFWGRVGITQSGGSRYESGRKVPRPVRLLVNLAFGSEAQAATAFQQLRNLTTEA